MCRKRESIVGEIVQFPNFGDTKEYHLLRQAYQNIIRSLMPYIQQLNQIKQVIDAASLPFKEASGGVIPVECAIAIESLKHLRPLLNALARQLSSIQPYDEKSVHAKFSTNSIYFIEGLVFDKRGLIDLLGKLKGDITNDSLQRDVVEKYATLQTRWQAMLGDLNGLKV